MPDISTLKISGTKVKVISDGPHNAIIGSHWRTSGMIAGTLEEPRILLSRGAVSCWVPVRCLRIA